MPTQYDQVSDLDKLWNALALERIRHLAKSMRAFSSDDIWEVLDDLPKPSDPRLLSIASKRAMADGLIQKSDLVIISKRGVSGGRPINVWLSTPLNAQLQDALEYVLAHKRTVSAPTAQQLALGERLGSAEHVA